MATTLALEPLVVLREVGRGIVYAHPLAEPKFVARAGSPEAALRKVEDFLAKFLVKVPAEKIADYIYPEATVLEQFAIVVPRADLPHRLRPLHPITIPGVIVPDGHAKWALVVPLREAVFVARGEDLVRRVTDEVIKAASAREIDGVEYLAILPFAKFTVVRAKVAVERPDLADLGARSSERRRQQSSRERERAEKLLKQVANELKSDGTKSMAPVVARDREVKTLASLLGGTDRMSVAIIGPEMAGKSAILKALVAGGQVKNRRVFATSGAQLVAGQSGFGELQERIDAVMKAVEQLDAVLYFDNLGDLFAGHSGGIEDMAAMMRPFVAQARVRIVGELSPDQLEHYEKLHVGFFGALHRLTVEPLTKEPTLELMMRRREHVAEREPDRPNLTAEAITPLCDLAERYLRYQAFPGKVVRLFEELRAVHDSDVEDDGTPKRIGPYEVYGAFSTRSGIPLFLLRDEQAMKFAEVEKYFRTRIIGQRESVRRVAETLCMVKAELQPPAKPLANFLFVGPTGVGKTEVAKTLARFLFGGPDRMVRFDMSEYTDPLAAERLIRGTDREEGELTRKVRQQPFCVLLLDEIEKAHSAVFDLLLQVCGEGRLTDARGKTTWFHNAIIIMTSNLGAAHRRPHSGFGGVEDATLTDERHYLDQVGRHFRPEFVNRIDRIIPFRALSREEIAEVARVSLHRIRERDGLLGRSISLEVSEKALAELAESGYSDRYGARALRRHLEDHLVAPIAATLSSNASDLADGAEVEVLAADETPVSRGDDDASISAEFQAEALKVVLRRPPKERGRRAAGDLESVARFRRTAARCMQLPPIVEMRERIAYLVADIASGSKPGQDAASGVRLSALAVEHARLRDRLAEPEARLLALESSEELAMAALEEGEGTELFVEEAETAMAHFETAFVRAVLAADAGDSSALIVRADDPFAMKRWLVGMLEGAEDRDWTVKLNRFEDRLRDDTWPRDLIWGPPRTGKWALEVLNDATEKELSTHWRAVLIRVRGDLSASLLRLECGVCRYPPTAGESPGHVEIFRVADNFEASENDLRSKAYQLPEAIERSVLPKLVATRAWGSDGSLRLPKAGYMFRRVEHYWRDLERILFGPIADGLARGTDPLRGEDH